MHIQVELRFDGPARPNEVVVDCTVRVQGRTGVEMEVRMRAGLFRAFYVYVHRWVGVGACGFLLDIIGRWRFYVMFVYVFYERMFRPLSPPDRSPNVHNTNLSFL